MNLRSLASLATGVCAAALCFPASASYLYTFQYDPRSLNGGLIQYEAASISFTIDHIGGAGDSLSWASGSINGCAPSSMSVHANPTRTSFWVFPDEAGHCDNADPAGVSGLVFYAETVVTGAGIYDVTDHAGRLLGDADNATAYYANGSLTVSELDGGTVPEPATLALASLALVAAAGCRRRLRR